MTEKILFEWRAPMTIDVIHTYMNNEYNLNMDTKKKKKNSKFVCF